MDNWVELRECLTRPNKGVIEDAKKLREISSRARELREIFSRARGLREIFSRAGGLRKIFLRTYLWYRTQPPSSSPTKLGCRARIIVTPPSSMLGIMFLPSTMLSNPPSTCSESHPSTGLESSEYLLRTLLINCLIGYLPSSSSGIFR
ncbi:glutamine synthetase [Sesbania bispinosa]|nr:glutamine synthetase [Sesbania bispinosa]